MDSRERDTGPIGDVAVVGVGCRLPGGVTDLDGLWDILCHGVDTTSDIPSERWGAEYHSADPHAPGTSYCPRGSFLADVQTFDADFFGISPVEASEIDPQQRLLLETAWAAMEDSGTPREKWAGSRTGVYAGILAMDYTLLHAKTTGIDGINPYYASGKEFSFAAGRIGYVFGLHGPSMMVNAACSSSLIAVHLACQALRAGECDAALAGGVNLLLAPELNVFMSKVRALSPSGRCRPFDATADGVVRGEGAAMVVLKRTADALAAGDRILGVIAGSATNHDGRSAGLTAPNPEAQQAVLAQALGAARLEPRDLSYVEAHATGTPLGDPIEVAALSSVLGCDREPDDPLLVGSIKANFGHLDSAAGILGMLKAMLVVRHRTVPPQIHVERTIDELHGSGLAVATAVTPLADSAGPVYAGVSAFGLSGSNAHLIVASPPAPGTGAPQRPMAKKGRGPDLPLLLLSAPDQPRLSRHAAEIAARLAGPDAPEMAELFATAAVRRTHFTRRLAVRARDAGSVQAALEAFVHAAEHPALRYGDTSDARPLPFVHVFSGATAPPRMGLGLYRAQQVFRDTVDECAAVVEADAGWSLLTELKRGGSASSRRPDVGPTVLVAVQLALSRLWDSWGVPPTAVLGHGPGQIAAAAAAGALEAQHAMRLVLRVGARPMDAAADDRLVVVEAAPDDVSGVLADIDAIRIHDVLSRTAVSIAGPARAIRQATAALRRAGMASGPARVLSPFDVRPSAAEAEALVTGLPVRSAAPSVRFLSLPGDHEGNAEWVRQLIGPQQLWPAVDEYLRKRAAHFLELGPGPVLSAYLSAALQQRGRTGRVHAALNHAPDAVAASADALADMYVASAPLAWERVFAPPREAVPMPPTELSGRRFWLPGVTVGAQGGIAAEARPAPATGGDTTAGPSELTAPQPSPSPEAPTPIPRSEPVSREGIAAEVTRIAAVLLGHEEQRRLPRALGFFDLGMDSFTLARFAQQVSDRYGCDLVPGDMLDHPTIDQIADVISELGPVTAATPVPQEPPVPPAPSVAAVAPVAQVALVAPVAPVAGPAPEAGSFVAPDDAIAIIGIGARFPGADEGHHAYWQLLRDGVDASREVPADRWEASELVSGDVAPGTVATARGSFLDRVDAFDHGFFRVSAREARSMDPQQRLFLEVAWEALDDAAVDPRRVDGGRAGVFAGLNTTDYQQLVTRHTTNVDLYYGTGNSFSGTSGRLSYFLGLRGPSLSVDTACSASLTAVHLACQSIRAGECEIAVAGGANVITTPTVYLAMSAGGALSPDGRCKTFDAAADGYGRGEGIGAVVLKRLSQALADGDRVYAVIRGSAVNHNGASGGLTVPSADAQTEVIRTALERGGVDPADVDYVEAHGTGTRLGDGIELRALAAAYGTGRDPARPLLVGSAKTNIGHLEAAAGIAGLIKTVLALDNAEIPPHVHFHTPTSQVAWDRMPLRVTASRTPWRPGQAPRLAGVSAFGFTGTNAHVVISEPPSAPALTDEPAVSRRPFVLLVSGASEAALKEALTRMREYVAGRDAAGLRDCAYTAFRRAHHEYRRAVVGHNAAELSAALADPPYAGVVPAGKSTRTAFVYGETVGDLDWLELAAREPAFRAELERCEQQTGAQLGRSILAELGGGAATADGLVTFAVQCALARLWQSYGIEPDVHVGRGIGEVAAAVCGATMELAEGVRIAAGSGAAAAHATDGWSAATAAALVRPGPVLAVALCGGRAAAELAEMMPDEVHALGGVPDPRTVADVVARVFVHGGRLNHAQVTPRGRVVSLPRYPWQRRRHWIDVPVLLARDPQVAGHGGPHPHLAPAFVPVDQPDVRYHTVRGPLATSPETASIVDVLEVALAAARDALGDVPLNLTGIATESRHGQVAAGGRHPQLRLTREDGELNLTLHPADGSLPLTFLHARVGAGASVTDLALLDGRRAVDVRSTGGLLLVPDAVGAAIEAGAECLGGEPVQLSTVHAVDWWAPVDAAAVVHATAASDGTVDARVYAPDGTAAFALYGMRFLRTATSVVTPETAARWTGSGYRTRWESVDVPAASPVGTWAVRAATPASGPMAGGVAAALAERGAQITDTRASEVVLVVDGSETDLATIAPQLVAAARTAVAEGSRLSLVTTGGADPTGAVVQPAAAAAAAVARVIATEIGVAWGTLVDVPAGAAGATASAEALAAGASLPEDELAHTPSGWYAPRLDHAAPVYSPLPPAQVDPDRWYVVTDGLDPRNRPFVEWLLDQGVRRMVAVTTSADPVRLAELVEAGVVVRVVSPAGLAGALTDLSVGGVLHLAQPAPLRTLAAFDAAEAAADLERYQIACELDAATRGTATALFVVTGSAAAHFGAVGAAGRAAAEGALVALVAARRAAGEGAQLMRWMPRADTGDLSVRDAAGMAVSGVTPADAGDLREAFDLVIRSGVAHLDRAVLAEAAFVRAYGAPVRRSIVVAMATATGEAAAESVALPRVRDVLDLEPDQRLDRVLAVVTDAVAEALGEEDIAPDVGFFELGMDSVMSMALRTTVERDFGCSLTPTLTFEYPTSRALAAHVLDQIGGGVSASPASSALRPSQTGVDPSPTPAAVTDDLDDASDADLINRLALALSGARRLLDEKGQK